jgi:hypothetical protein
MNLELNEIERIEKLSLRALHTAFMEFGFDAWEYFRQSTDDPKDIAEDLTREILDRFGGYQIEQRIFGNVDYRKARFAILPELSQRQALYVDSKAEKSKNSATLQMSQLSMSVRQVRGGDSMDFWGIIKPIEYFNNHSYLTTTLLAHYYYKSSESGSGRDIPPYHLYLVTLAAIPNGMLQDRYNPDQFDTIWIAGRNAPTRGEAFRVRLSFNRLYQKAAWRVQIINYNANNNTLSGEWRE